MSNEEEKLIFLRKNLLPRLKNEVGSGVKSEKVYTLIYPLRHTLRQLFVLNNKVEFTHIDLTPEEEQLFTLALKLLREEENPSSTVELAPNVTLSKNSDNELFFEVNSTAVHIPLLKREILSVLYDNFPAVVSYQELIEKTYGGFSGDQTYLLQLIHIHLSQIKRIIQDELDRNNLPLNATDFFSAYSQRGVALISLNELSEHKVEMVAGNISVFTLGLSTLYLDFSRNKIICGSHYRHITPQQSQLLKAIAHDKQIYDQDLMDILEAQSTASLRMTLSHLKDSMADLLYETITMNNVKTKITKVQIREKLNVILFFHQHCLYLVEE